MEVKWLSEFCEPFQEICKPKDGLLGTSEFTLVGQKYGWPLGLAAGAGVGTDPWD